jgi:hypothetical protein
VTEVTGARWATRPWLALAVRAIVFAVPLGASLATVELLRRTLPSTLPRWATLVTVAVAALLVATGAERLGRRLLPLSSLLGMTMLFPDRAPSRLKVLRDSVSSRQLEARLADRDAGAAEAAATTLSLITALGGHDRRTRGHSERVRVFADLLGDELGLADAQRDRLRWSALLHDIGKLEIAGTVLNKPGKLDADEWDLIRAHPLDGARLAAPLLGWLGEWAGGIPEHHERYDGTGYPLGLAGTDISRAGRMVAVIDAFETMTAARSYKQPMNTRAARAELARCAGTHFDPQMVRAFLSISLPRLLWAMGPLALLVHLPFLRSLETAGSQVGSAVATGAGATVLAVGVTVVPAPAPAPQPRVVAQQEARSARTQPVPAPPGVRPTDRPAASPSPSATPLASPTPTSTSTSASARSAVRGPGAAPSRPASRPASRPVEWSTRMPRPDPVRTLTPSKGGDRQDHGADAEDQKDKQSRKKAKETEGGKDDD